MSDEGPTIRLYGSHLPMFGDSAVFLGYEEWDGYTKAEYFVLLPDCSLKSGIGELQHGTIERLEEQVEDFKWDVEEYLVDEATRDIKVAYSEFLREEEVPNPEAWVRSGVDLESGSVPRMSRMTERDECLEALEEIKKLTDFSLLEGVVDAVSSIRIERRGGWQ